MPSGQRPFPPWPSLAAALLCASAACGCQPDCGEKQIITYEKGTTDPTHTLYQTSPVTGPWLHFPPLRNYILVHSLRTFPVEVHVSLAFAESGENLATGAGRESVWNIVPDSGAISVTNDSCAEFYVYVVARAAPDPGPDAGDPGPDAGDASTD
jgi:hypothetical protein